MDLNVYNSKYTVMNPSDLSMIWMGHYAPDRSMIVDESPNVFAHQGLTGIMDDLAQQTNAMDMNPMMGIIGGDFHHPIGTSSLTQSSSITPDLYGLHVTQSTQATLDNYNDDNEYDDSDEQNNDGLVSYCEDDPDEYQTEVLKEHDGSDYSYFTQEHHHSNSNDDDIDSLAKNTIATQTYQQSDVYRKIEPFKRPGLVLKTPIAYKGDIDPSFIPIRRDGMAVCLRCGAIGVKHSFYTKERRYCSMACARGYNDSMLSATPQNHAKTNNSYKDCNDDEANEASKDSYNFRFKMSSTFKNDNSPMLYRDLIPQEDLPQIPKSSRLPSPCPQDDKIQTVRRKPSDFGNSYDWSSKLNDPNFFAGPVTCFRHAPGYDTWSNIGIGMKVEVENTDCDNNNQITAGLTPHSFWVGTVLTIFGYKAQIRYEGFDKNNSHDFWVNLCSAEVHPVGWCATRGKPLIPPKTIENKYKDWKEFLVERLSGARTLPSTFYNKINESLKSRFRCGLNIEVVDKNRISQIKLATIHKIVGKRLYVQYFDSPPEDNGFWCHEDSPLIHPVGWATTVGHNLSAPSDYLERMQGGHEQLIETLEDDATIDLFKMNFSFEEHYLEERGTGFVEGMKLEAIDPLNLSSICVATVMAVLKFGYMMIRIDSYDPDITGADWFCYHEKSPCIFPVGFCKSNDITLTPPKGYEVDTFDWNEYLDKTNSLPASDDLFNREIPKHGFKIGMKLECADLMDPRLVCVATISRVVGRLLKVHFDGWEDEYDQWLDCESPDMYPVGWCVLVGHNLEGPLIKSKVPPLSKVSPKTTRKKRKKKVKVESTSKSIYLPSNKKENLDNVSVKIELKHEPLEVDVDSESFSSEQASPSSVRSEVKFYPSIEERLKVSSCSNLSQSPSPSQQPAPPTERKVTSYINNSSVNSSKYIPRILDSTSDSGINSSGGNVTSSSNIGNINVLSGTSSNNISNNNNNIQNNNSNCVSSNNNCNNELTPDIWNMFDVAQFLRVNDCTGHCDTFARNKIDGKRLLELTKDEIIEILGMKVGPALKIYDLIQQLKCKIDPVQSRKMKANLNKKFL